MSTSDDRPVTEAGGLTKWTLGASGKFLVTVEGVFHHWRIDDTGCPHHGQVAQRLGVVSVVDGFIEPSGAYWTSARNPSVDTTTLMSVLAADGVGVGLTPARRPC